MANFKIITNNPMALDKYSEWAEYCQTSVEGVFTACRDAVHQGAVLICHPLSGSVKPNVNPYKSVVISDGKPRTDFDSLRLIESALETLKKLRPAQSMRYSDSVLEDFQVIDLDLLDSAMTSLPPEYHI